MNKLNSYQNDMNNNYISNSYKINNEISNNIENKNLNFSTKNKKIHRYDYYSNFTEIPSNTIYPQNNINADKHIKNNNINNYKDIQAVSINVSPMDTPKEYKFVNSKISFNNIKRYNTNINDPNIQKNAKKVIVMKIIKNDKLNQKKNDNNISNNNIYEGNNNKDLHLKKRNTYINSLNNTEFREKRKSFKFNDDRNMGKKLKIKYNYSEKFPHIKNKLLPINGYFHSDILNYPYIKNYTNIKNDNNNKNNKFDLSKSIDLTNFPKNSKVIYRRKNFNIFKKFLDISPSLTNKNMKYYSLY